MALTKATTSITDWTAVAQAAVGESATYDLSAVYDAVLNIQAFLDTTTAHTGTEFIIQISANDSGDEDWQDLCRFVGIIATNNTEPVTNNPLAAGSTTITCASTTGYAVADVPGPLIAIKDATLINSEICQLVSIVANTSVTVLDGTTNEHANTAILQNTALSENISLPMSANRVRVLVNNDYDSNGSTMNYKVRISTVTAI